ncbi:glycoside hydrolase family 6 protein [Sanguibacter sp. Leaf3]|uniref:glycoside hydrolase family 6 protein n=1 Tax=Sanguibacter sp. Leaf3 TaxID=1736209 RepID=UPI0006FBFD51|nr:glycoside hydrolase family 6 protein [Sanguibacter sp. Leaf3]KQT96391.1 hypothetical protein ASG53_14845 [Sanguibacter sp. Leaf3]
MARTSSDEPDAPLGPRDPRYVIRVPADESPEEPEVLPVRGGRTDAPEARPASDYVIRAGSSAEVPTTRGTAEVLPSVRSGQAGEPAAPAAAGTAVQPGLAAPTDTSVPTVVGGGAQAGGPGGPSDGSGRGRRGREARGPRPPRRRRSRASRWLTVLAVLVVVVAVAAVVVVRSGLLDGDNPFAGRDLYVDPDSQAIRAVDSATDSATRDAFLTIADQPTGIWLTPEKYPAGEVGPFVAQVVADAAAQDTLPLFVVYGVPDRDCGQFSAGGTTVEGYEVWVREIAAALDGTGTPVILEPDSISLAEQCGDVEGRLSLVSTAGATLTDAGATVYLDGGHSNWHSVQETADLLRRAGIAGVHGFATNVSNYNDDASELAYAQRLSAQLDGAPFVVDTGRNGNGSDGTWCNPPGAALGARPMTLEAEGLDANLWVKPPGESDGTCGGGPVAGEWWVDRALSLVAEDRA